MKKKLLLFVLIGLFGLFFLGCSGSDPSGDDNTPEDDKPEDKTEEVAIEFDEKENNKENIKSVAKQKYDDAYEEAAKELTKEQLAVFEIKYNEITLKIELTGDEVSVEELKKELNDLYQELYDTIDLVKKTASTFEEEKQIALDQLKMIYDSVAAVANESTIEYVKSLYNEAVESIKATTEENKAQISDVVKNFQQASKDYVKVVANEVLEAAIEETRKYLKEAYETAIAKVNSETLKTQAKELYEKYDLKIAGVVDNDNYEEVFAEYLKSFVNDLYEVVKNDGVAALEVYKSMAISEFEKYIDEGLKAIEDESVKLIVKGFSDLTVAQINALTTVEEVKNFYNNIPTLIKTYVKDTLAPTVIAKVKLQLDIIVNTALLKISDEDLRKEVKDFYDNEIAKLSEATTIEELETKVNELKDNLLTEINNKVSEYTVVLVNKAKTLAKEKIQELTTQALAKVSDEDIKKELQDASDAAIAEIDKVTDYETLEASLKTIQDNYTQAITNILKKIALDMLDESKAEAKEKLEEALNTALAKVTDAEVQKELRDLCTKEIAEIDKITDAETAEATLTNIANDFTKGVTDILTKYATKKLNEAKAAAKLKIEQGLDAALAKVEDEDVKTELRTLCTNALADLENVKDAETAEATLTKIANDFSKGITDILTKYATKKLNEAKVAAKAKLDQALETALAKVSDENIKTEIRTAYNNAIAELDKVDSYETAEAAFKKIADDLEASFVKILEKVASEKLEEAKIAAKAKLDLALEAALAKVESEDAKATIRTAYNNAIAELNNVKDEATAEAALAKISDDFKAAVLDVSKELAKEVATKLAGIILSKLSEEAQAAFNQKTKELNDELAAADDESKIEIALNKFKEAIKPYITEALNNLKTEAINTLKGSYDEILAQIDIQDYKDQLLTVYNNCVKSINDLNDIETIATEVKTIATNFANDAKTVLSNYLVAAAEASKTDVLARAKVLYDGYKDTEEYKALGTVKKLAAQTAISAAYKTFTAAVEKVEPVAGANLAYEEAYNAFVLAYNAALGITAEN